MSRIYGLGSHLVVDGYDCFVGWLCQSNTLTLWSGKMNKTFILFYEFPVE